MKFDWDKIEGIEILIRRMLYGDIEDLRDILKKYKKDYLKTIFLENLHRFHEKNREFWKVILEVTDDQINERTRENFRENTGIRDFP